MACAVPVGFAETHKATALDDGPSLRRGTEVTEHLSRLVALISLLRPPTASFTPILSATRPSNFLIGNDRGSLFKIYNVSFDDHPPLVRNHSQAQVVSDMTAKTDHDAKFESSTPRILVALLAFFRDRVYRQSGSKPHRALLDVVGSPVHWNLCGCVLCWGLQEAVRSSSVIILCSGLPFLPHISQSMNIE